MATTTSSRGEPFERRDLPLIVVSAVALVSGGPLTILNQAVAGALRFQQANFVFLVHDAKQWATAGNLRFVPVPWARRSYTRRLFAEYLLFPRLSRRWRPDAWLSLHDTTPPVAARRQAVYCQNPLPCWRPTLRDLRMAPATVFRSKVYGVAYRAFADRNDHMIGQLPWFTEAIGTYIGLPRSRWVVVTPTEEARSVVGPGARSFLPPDGDSLDCFYPSLPRVFKNFEEAIDLCDQPGIRLTLTLAGDENRYARHVRARAERFGNVRLAGMLTHRDTLATMAAGDVVLFPSRLETFGLPIREAIELNRTVVLPVRPWTTAIAAHRPNAFFYRSIDEGREILRALAHGERPRGTDPPPNPEPDLPQLEGFEALYGLLLD